ncbi:MAG: rod shape-determining protein MreC [Acidimicrobiales bacterium]
MALAPRTGRSRHRLILLALTAITLLTVDLNGFGPIAGAQRLARDMLNPVTSLTASVFSPVGNAWNSVFNYGELEDENAALRAEVEELRGAAIRGEADTETLRRLLEATELDYVGDVETVAAEVQYGSIGNFDDHLITINKGADEGLAPGMAVVTAAGLVGRVDAVTNTTATVKLLSDTSVFVGARLVSTDKVGLGHADPGGSGLFVIDRGLDYPATDDPALIPAVGSAVVTAGESGYPADIPIGRVLSVERSADEASMRVEVELSNAVDDLQFVSVIVLAPPTDFPLLDPVLDVVPAGTDPDADPDEATDGGAGDEEADG